MSAIHEVAARQAEWAATADRLKRSFQRGRWTNLMLMIVAALFAAVASQLDGAPRLILASTSAVLFGIVTFLTTRLVTAANAQEWVRARAASEALKRLAYTYAAAAAPYDDAGTRDDTLKAAARQIQRQVDHLLARRVSAPPDSRLTQALTPADYVEQRAAAAAAWYDQRADQYSAVVRRLRRIEFVLALATAVVTAVAGALGKQAGSFDFVALTAVLTTISGAILAHVEAARYDYLIVTYRASALQLRDALADEPARLAPASPAWSAFVQACERLIATENGSWVMKMAMP